MIREEQGFLDSDGGVQLFYRLYFPPTPWQDILVIFHGHGEHSGRYRKFADHLKEKGMVVASFDFRGTGQSGGREVYVDSLEDYVSDADAFVRYLRRHLAFQKKIVLLGHSLGGLTALSWAEKNLDGIKCLILSSPCLGLKIPGFLRGFNKMMDRYWPGLVYQNPVYPPHLTHNPEEMKEYKQDPLIKRKISVRLLNEMIKYMAFWSGRDRCDFPFPVHVLMAGLERVVDGDATRRFFDCLRCPKKTLKVFENFYHEIFNESGQDLVFAELNGILEGYLSGKEGDS